jgi:hypothetical protein
MNVLSSIPLYSFIKVDFITKLTPGTYRRALSFAPTETVIAFQLSPLNPFPTGNFPVSPPPPPTSATLLVLLDK